LVNLCLSSRGDVNIRDAALSRHLAGVGLYDKINDSNMGRWGQGCIATLPRATFGQRIKVVFDHTL
jgi:hypothetical protein